MATNWGGRGIDSFITTQHSAPYPAISPSLATLPHPFTVCIIGASRGIGASIATAYAQAGASGIILASRRLSGLLETQRRCKEISPEGVALQVEVVETDITSANSVGALAQWVENSVGALDVVVVNSGFSGNVELTLTETDPATFQQAIDVNYVGTFLCAKYLVPLLLITPLHSNGKKKKKQASFLVVSSLASLIVRGPIANAQYCVSKLAQLKLMEHIHEQYSAASGDNPDAASINAISIHPGAVASEMALETAPKEFLGYLTESPDLCGSFCVWLTKDEQKSWLSGRLVSALWDVEELEKKKEEIVQGDLLKVGLRT